MWSGDKLACRWFITIYIFHSFITFHYFPFKGPPRRCHGMVWWSWSTLEWRIAAFRPSDVQSIIHTFTNYLTSICGMDCVWRIHKFCSCSLIHHFTMSSCGYVRSDVYRSLWTFVKKKWEENRWNGAFFPHKCNLVVLMGKRSLLLSWDLHGFWYCRILWSIVSRLYQISDLKPIFVFTDSLGRFPLYSCFFGSYLIGSISMMIY